MSFLQSVQDTAGEALAVARQSSPGTLFAIFLAFVLGTSALIWSLIYLVSPVPRPPQRSEQQYITALPDGAPSAPQPLPSWCERWVAAKIVEERDVLIGKTRREAEVPIEPAEIFMSVVVPAFNEEDRLPAMLEEAWQFLEKSYGGGRKGPMAHMSGHEGVAPQSLAGWEILVVSDGSTDCTVDVALDFAHQKRCPAGSVRVVRLEQNRGKGGAVTHGLRHVRGQYAVFADADGASKFEDLADLVACCQKIEDPSGRAVAIGSRAHLVGSEAVVKRSFIRNLLMHAFHILIRLLTPPATSRIRDTQCGFKLFSRAALPHIIPYMHSEGWIFDIEMLMLTEMAGIPMQEVAVGWHEVEGSKLNVVWASLGMAWGMMVLRSAWGTGVYSKSLM